MRYFIYICCMKNNKIDGFLLALMISLTFAALITVLYVGKSQMKQDSIEYETVHFAPMQSGLK